MMMVTSWQCPDDLHHWPLTVTNWWPGWGTRRPPLSLGPGLGCLTLRMLSPVSMAQCLHTVSVLKSFFSLFYPRHKEINFCYWHLVIKLSFSWLWHDWPGLRHCLLAWLSMPEAWLPPRPRDQRQYRVSDAVSLGCERLWDDDNVCSLRNISFWEGRTVLLGDQVLKFLSRLSPSICF